MIHMIVYLLLIFIACHGKQNAEKKNKNHLLKTICSIRLKLHGLIHQINLYRFCDLRCY